MATDMFLAARRGLLAGLYTGKKILVTGGTGSIGRELTGQLLKAGARVVRALSNDENGLFDMEQQFSDDRIRYLLGDVRDPERMESAAQGVDFVFHAAALKHVPIGEYNPFELVMTNVVGTKNVIDACLHDDARNFVLISTDKAVNPISTLGASKLLCEKLVVDAAAYKGPRRTKFTCVRFGNVLKTRGSVTEVFARQLANGGPLTLTDAEMTRFVLDQQTAVARVLKAAKVAEGGEIFVMKMKSLRIRDLAEVSVEEFARSHRLEPSSIQIKFSGARPGEKIHEELMTDTEASNCAETEEFYILLPRTFASRTYGNLKRSIVRPYTSRDGPLMAKEEIRQLLRFLN